MRGLNALLAVLGAALAVLVLCGLLLHTPGAGSVDSIGLVGAAFCARRAKGAFHDSRNDSCC